MCVVVGVHVCLHKSLYESIIAKLLVFYLWIVDFQVNFCFFVVLLGVTNVLAIYYSFSQKKYKGFKNYKPKNNRRSEAIKMPHMAIVP